MHKRILLFISILIIIKLTTTAQETATITDTRDGKTYKTVTIGSQTWMAENLNFETPMSWCIDCEVYGRTYTFDAAMKACPVGWHLPSETEWTVLTDQAGGGSVLGGNLKETGTQHWKSPNTGATNKSGFNAIPHGYRSFNGILNFETKMGSWWSSTTDEKFKNTAWSLRLDYNKSTVSNQPTDKLVGISVRCIKD